LTAACVCVNMVADSITKEEAAKFVKKMQNDSAAQMKPQMNMMANFLWMLFTMIDDIDYSNVELEEGEAEELLSEPFDAAEDFAFLSS